MQGIDFPRYTSPLCLIMEIVHEGLLCVSGINGGFSHEGIGGDDEIILNN